MVLFETIQWLGALKFDPIEDVVGILLGLHSHMLGLMLALDQVFRSGIREHVMKNGFIYTIFISRTQEHFPINFSYC